MSTTPSSPNSSPAPDISPSADSPSSNSSVPSPSPGSPPPRPNPSPSRGNPPPRPNPSASTPPPTNSSAPSPSNSTTPPPVNSTAPPAESPPADSPPPSAGATPPPSNSEPPPPPPSPSPPSPPPVTPPTPVAPPPRNNTPPAPPPNDPPPRPSPPPSNPAAPPPVVPPRPSPPAPPAQSPPAPPKLQPPPAPQPSVPGSPAPPSQSNTTVPSAPSTPTKDPPADADPPSPSNATGRVPVAGVIAIVLVGLLAISLVVFAAWFLNRRKKRRSESNDGNTNSSFFPSQNTGPSSLRTQNAPIVAAHHSADHSAQANGSSSTKNSAPAGDPGGIGNSKPFFTYEELSLATNGFSAANLLGEGGFGCVYKGNLADGKEVAVKQLKIGGGQGEREFQAEVEIISRIHHRHLVSIVGYCISDFQRLLVYDYVPNNTLYYHLHENVSVMTWPTRFRVAAGAARGIAYLHEDCNPRIIHRDIKSSNILLDNNFEAKVADFGLAKLALELEVHTHISTRVMGTFGYMAPEYATTGKLTEKSDVFSFGVVLLELITGRKPVDSTQEIGDESLVEWARPLLTQALESENCENLVDPRLQNEYVEIEMFRLAEAAAACVRHSASKRPKMSQVVRAIDSISEVQDLTNGMKPGDSHIIDSREQSAQIRFFQRMAFGPHEFASDEFGSSQSTKSGF